MDSTRFERVDQYLDGLFGCSDAVLTDALRRSEEAGLPAIQVSAVQGKMLTLFARMLNARRVLEIGTLGGFSTICLARGLADGGRLWTLELEPRHAEVARQNLNAAGVGDRVDILVGPAGETLERMAADSEEPFDLIFLDADKVSYRAYLELSLKLSRPGTVILADNVIRGGNVVAPAPDDAESIGVGEFNRVLAACDGVEAVVTQLVGSKGHDGLAIAVVK